MHIPYMGLKMRAVVILRLRVDSITIRMRVRYLGLGEVLGEQVVTSSFVVGYPQSDIGFIRIFCSPVQP